MKGSSWDEIERLMRELIRLRHRVEAHGPNRHTAWVARNIEDAWDALLIAREAMIQDLPTWARDVEPPGE